MSWADGLTCLHKWDEMDYNMLAHQPNKHNLPNSPILRATNRSGRAIPLGQHILFILLFSNDFSILLRISRGQTPSHHCGYLLGGVPIWFLNLFGTSLQTHFLRYLFGTQTRDLLGLRIMSWKSNKTERFNTRHRLLFGYLSSSTTISSWFEQFKVIKPWHRCLTGSIFGPIFKDKKLQTIHHV